jgi:pSer/pThr/pTyr-binding forkhead associated (FHA) protein
MTLKCAICGNENREGSFFCGQCGAKLHFMGMPQAYLLTVNAGGDCRRYPISSRVSYIGREDVNQVAIPNEAISKKHAKLTFADGKFYIEDLSSSNGTFLNGTRVHVRTALRNGDLIRLGAVIVKFEISKQEAQAA